MKKHFLNADLNRTWANHVKYFKSIRTKRECRDMIDKEEAIMGVERKPLYILSVNLTPYFYATKDQRDSDYKKVLKLIGK